MEINTQDFDKKKYPLVGNNFTITDEIISCEKKLSLDTDNYLDDHRFNNVPFLPGVIGLETFAEMIKIAFPEKIIKYFQDVNFSSAIVLKKDLPKKVKIEIESKNELLIAKITSQKKNDANEIETKTHFQTKIVFGERSIENELPPTLLKMPLLNKEIIYQVLPHGLLFQVLSEINKIDNKVIAIFDSKKEKEFGWKKKQFLTSPLFIEAGFQSIGLMDFILNGNVGLPSKIGKLTFFKTTGKPYFIIGWKDKNSFSFLGLTKGGEIVLKAENYQTVDVNLGDTTSALEKIRSHRIRQLFKLPKMSWIEVVNKQLLEDKLSRESDFKNTFLNETEKKRLHDLNDQEKIDYLLEIFTIKRALRIVLRSTKMQDFVLLKNKLGGYYYQKGGKKIWITLSKTEHYFLAIASYKQKYGICLEAKDKKRKIEKNTLLNARELKILEEYNIDSEFLLLLGTIKKAAQKLIGESLNLNFHDFTITNIENNRLKLEVELKNLQEEEFNELKTRSIKLEAYVRQNENFVAVICSR